MSTARVDFLAAKAAYREFPDDPAIRDWYGKASQTLDAERQYDAEAAERALQAAMDNWNNRRPVPWHVWEEDEPDRLADWPWDKWGEEET